MVTRVFLTTTGAGSFTVPSDWNSSSNTIEVIAGGGGGGNGAYANSGAGGGYAKIVNASLTPGASVSYAVGIGGPGGAEDDANNGTAGTAGGDTWFGASTYASALVAAKGGQGAPAGAGAAAAGGPAASGIGTVKYSGGAGTVFNADGWAGGSGGGGAAGPNGDGGAGGPVDSGAGLGGAGGGAGGGGTAGSQSSGDSGAAGGSGVSGSGNGGLGGNGNTVGTAGAAGAPGTEWSGSTDGDTVNAEILYTGDSYAYYWYPTSDTVPCTFSASDSENVNSASFLSNGTLTITDEGIGSGAVGWVQTYSDSTNPLTSVSLISSGFNPPISWSLSDGTLTVSWVGEEGTTATYSAVFQLNSRGSGGGGGGSGEGNAGSAGAPGGAGGLYGAGGGGGTNNNGVCYAGGPGAQGLIVLSYDNDTASTDTAITAGAGTASFAGHAPSVLRGTSIAAGKGTASLAGRAPSVAAGTGLTAGKGTASLAGHAPSVTRGTSLTAGKGTASFAGYPPVLVSTLTVTPGFGALSLAGYAPGVAFPADLGPGFGLLQMTGLRPLVSGAAAPSLAVPRLGRPRVPTDAVDSRQHRRQIASTLNDAMSGHLDCTTSVSLTPSATSTVLTDARIGLTTAALLHPTTANAAAEMASGSMYWVVSAGTLSITHRNATSTDRNFTIALLG